MRKLIPITWYEKIKKIFHIDGTKATFGGDVEVDGDLQVNGSINDIDGDEAIDVGTNDLSIHKNVNIGDVEEPEDLFVSGDTLLDGTLTIPNAGQLKNEDGEEILPNERIISVSMSEAAETEYFYTLTKEGIYKFVDPSPNIEYINIRTPDNYPGIVIFSNEINRDFDNYVVGYDYGFGNDHILVSFYKTKMPSLTLFYRYGLIVVSVEFEDA